ncbi:MAG TPA: hypothetical protein VNP37_18490 [Actinomycetospora sp.]|nr:hypothetical protein [Actinomycetospora sp.]
MAKDKKSKNGHDAGQDAGQDAVATALTAPDAPADAVVETPPAAAPASAAPASGAPGPRPRSPAATTPSRPAAGPGLADGAVSAVSDVARVVRTVLPNRVPAYLGGAALLVLGVVDLPAVAGGALAYEAIRRWRPAPPTGRPAPR